MKRCREDFVLETYLRHNSLNWCIKVNGKIYVLDICILLTKLSFSVHQCILNYIHSNIRIKEHEKLSIISNQKEIAL